MDKKLQKISLKGSSAHYLELTQRSLYSFRSRPRKTVPPIPSAYCVEYMASDQALRKYGVRLSSIIYVATEEDFFALLDTKEEGEKIQEALVKKILKYPQYLPRLIKWSERQKNSLKNILKKYFSENKIQLKTNIRVIISYKKFIEAYRNFHLKNTPAWWIGGIQVEKEIMDYLNKNVPDPAGTFSIISEALEYRTENLEMEEALEIFALDCRKAGLRTVSTSIKIPTELRKRFQKIVDNFQSIPFGYDTGVLWDENYFLDKVNELLPKNIEQLKRERVRKLQKKLRERELLEKRLHLPKRITLLLKALRQLAYLQELKKTTQTRSHPLLQRTVHAEIARRLQIPREYLYYMTLPEICDSLTANKVSDNLIINLEERTGTFVFIQHDLKYTWLTKEKALEFIKINKIIGEVNNITEIRGQIASRGKSKGIVKVCRLSTEIFKVTPGDILVTAMTTPDFVPAMKKAAAIITDEGGITCHAAIVSRELGKPCIIGTKIATKVLKDGDLVEVDADKGIVRKLS